MNNQNQPLFGKTSRAINSPITNINRSMSPIPSISLNNNPLEQTLGNINSIYSIPSVNPQSPFTMMMNNSIGQNIPSVNIRSTSNTGIVSNQQASSLPGIVSNQQASSLPGIVTKSYKFNHNSKELHKFILYIKNKKQFNTSKKLIDVTFFELLKRLSSRPATLRSRNKNITKNRVNVPVVTFDGDLHDSKIVHISNAKSKQQKQSISLSSDSSLQDLQKKNVPIPTNNIVSTASHANDFFKQCDLCPKSFDDPINYKLHKKQHVIMNGGKNVCPKCFKGFARTDAMKRHLGTKTCDRNRKKLIDENNGIMPERPPTELQLESELST